MKIVDFVDEGLGHSSYLVDLGDGRALIIDPPRIPAAHLAAADACDLVVAYTADTHSHADYVSGSPELAARGATFLASKGAGLEVPHQGVEPGEEIALADRFTLRAVPTPGHTPDHLAYLLCENGQPVGLFSGGSLMVGTVGRTDLFGPEAREDLARQLYRALRDEILTLPDALVVYPTHGAGSFCSAPGTSDRTTTIGRERATNPLLRAVDEDTFVAQLLRGFGSFPAYFSRLPEVNRLGPRLYGNVPELRRTSIEEVDTVLDRGGLIVDARPISAFAAGHVPGSLSIELRPVFASWLGWLVAPDRPLVFVLDADQDRTELVRQCLTVGYEWLAGELDGGIDAWRAYGRDAARIPLVDASEVRGTIVDVRQRAEYESGHVPGAVHVELGSLWGAPVPEGPLTVMCGHGERAMTGASVLETRGHRELAVLSGGPTEWCALAGSALDTGA